MSECLTFMNNKKRGILKISPDLLSLTKWGCCWTYFHNVALFRTTFVTSLSEKCGWERIFNSLSAPRSEVSSKQNATISCTELKSFALLVEAVDWSVGITLQGCDGKSSMVSSLKPIHSNIRILVYIAIEAFENGKFKMQNCHMGDKDRETKKLYRTLIMENWLNTLSQATPVWSKVPSMSSGWPRGCKSPLLVMNGYSRCLFIPHARHPCLVWWSNVR